MNKTEKKIDDYFKESLEKIIYLSPDAEINLTEFSPEYKYVIGGLVDGKIKKNCSKKVATDLKV